MIHCGFVGLIGLPNAGKSSLMNAIVNEKVSIISSKPQTTRQSFSGLWSEDNFQLVFFDSPGFVNKRPGLFDFLAAEFDRVIEKSDVLVFLISHEQKKSSDFDLALCKVKETQKPVHYVFSKIDIQPTPFVVSMKEQLIQDNIAFQEVSLKSTGLMEQFRDYLRDLALTLPQEQHALYDREMISLDNTRDIVSEYIREECFERLNKEIPFGLAVIVESFKKEKGLTHIQARIIVEKENHKAIVIGKGGQQLRDIGKGARAKIEELLGEKIFLGLHVVHKKNWLKNKAIMRELGYSHDKR